jgi:uncharacterized protein (TIGR03086 family)
MSEISDRYRRLSSAMADRIAAVPDDAWSNPTPCEDWTARDLVRHLVDTPAMVFGFVDRPAPSGGPSVDDDPAGAFDHVREAVQSSLDDPEVATLSYDGMFGPSTFEQGVGQFLCTDLVIHGWDLARATGQDERLDPDDVHAIFEAMQPMDEQMRGPGAFGPKVEPPPGADEQTQLLCFLGRQV